MGSIFYQGSGIKILGEMGLRDQNNGKKIGINGSRIYHVTTLGMRYVGVERKIRATCEAFISYKVARVSPSLIVSRLPCS